MIDHRNEGSVITYNYDPNLNSGWMLLQASEMV